MTDQSQIGQAVRKLRSWKGLTQAALAGRAGLTRNYIALIECGKKEASGAAMRRLVDALDVPDNYLLFLQVKVSAHSRNPVDRLIRETQKAICETMRLSS